MIAGIPEGSNAVEKCIGNKLISLTPYTETTLRITFLRIDNLELLLQAVDRNKED